MAPSAVPSAIVFVCTANLVRSAFAAAAVTQLRLKPRPWAEVPVLSTGVLAGAGHAPPRDAVAAARRLGVDLSGHRSTPMTAIPWSGAVAFGMTPTHVRAAIAAGAARAELLGAQSARGDIVDPIGQAGHVYDAVFAAILEALQVLATKAEP